MGNKFTRKLKFGSSSSEKGTEGGAAVKGTADAEPNAKAPSSSVDKKEPVAPVNDSEVKDQNATVTDTEDVKVTVNKEPGPDIPKINVTEEEDAEEVDIVSACWVIFHN